MSTDADAGADGPPGRRISLIEEDDMWVAVDENLDIASQGYSPHHALEMLEEAVALHRGEAGEAIEPDGEREALEDLGIDPDEVEEGRAERDEPPEWMN